MGLISKEYTVCSQARHTDCEVDDLEYKVANGLPLGEHLGRIQHMELCHPEEWPCLSYGAARHVNSMAI